MIIDCVQGSPEWAEARLGRVTASKVADVVARTKTGWGASRANYMAALIAERLTGKMAESYTNASMQWGTEHEAEARDLYAFMQSVTVTQIGFAWHPRVTMSGASPDGLVGDDGLVEIKCPNTATHIDTLLGGSIDKKYMTQMQWQMACCGRAWCDFVSYDPRLPPAMQMHTVRVSRDDAMIADLERDVREFLIELDDKLARLNGRFGSPTKAKLEQSVLMAG